MPSIPVHRWIRVYPSENYYYFILNADGKQMWGNIWLSTKTRDDGVLSFAYFEFREFPNTQERGQTHAKLYTKADDLDIEKIDRFTYLLRYKGKEVAFNLHQLSQEPPNLFPLGDGEVFVQRTFDESGYQFFLLFNDLKNYFFWVLNEEELVPDPLQPLQDDLLVGKRSGFAFWVDAAHGDRKVLAAIRRESQSRNDYYDGPFDQLADNYVDEVGILDYLLQAAPQLEGRIDKFGYYLNRQRESRVALSLYFIYTNEESLKQFIARARASEDPSQFISRRGRPVRPTASTPAPPGTTPVSPGSTPSP